MIAELFFWIFLFILIYTYAGYALILYLLCGIKKAFGNSKKNTLILLTNLKFVFL
ncbi:MAG: hypothetical protein ACOCVA_01690 [Prolixibacteraceae bacterium]